MPTNFPAASVISHAFWPSHTSRPDLVIAGNSTYQLACPLAALPVIVVKDVRAVIGANEFREAAADHFIGAVLEQPQRMRIHEPEIPFGVGFKNDVGRGINEVAVTVFAGLQRLFGGFAIGDVAEVDHDRADARLLQQIPGHGLDPTQRRRLCDGCGRCRVRAPRDGRTARATAAATRRDRADSIRSPRRRPARPAASCPNTPGVAAFAHWMMPSASASTTASTLKSINDPR